MTEEEEEYTLNDVVRNIGLIQDMKLLFLQGITKKGKDISIHHIVDEKALVKILERYRDHYDEVMKYNNVITIFNLNKLSFLRVGLEKEVLKFMEPYMDE
jgi:hypothetical protein